MDLIYFRFIDDTVDSGYLTHFKGDFEISADYENGNNNFEVVTDLDPDNILWKDGWSTYFMVPGTEWGGIVTGSTIDAGKKEITYRGYCYRDLLHQTIIEPPTGQDYKTVSGDLFTILSEQIPWHPLIMVNDAGSYTSPAFSFNRYVTAIDGVTALLNAINPNLRVYLSVVPSEDVYKVELTVGTVRDVTNKIQVSQDYGEIPLKITYEYDTPHHLIALGQGELKDREVRHFYVCYDWTITTNPDSWKIADPYPAEVYDFSNSANLYNDGLAKMQEIIANHRNVEVDMAGIEGLGLNEIISAKDEITGETITAEITGIIWRVENYGDWQTESFEYKTKVKVKQ